MVNPAQFGNLTSHATYVVWEVGLPAVVFSVWSTQQFGKHAHFAKQTSSATFLSLLIIVCGPLAFLQHSDQHLDVHFSRHWLFQVPSSNFPWIALFAAVCLGVGHCRVQMMIMHLTYIFGSREFEALLLLQCPDCKVTHLSWKATGLDGVLIQVSPRPGAQVARIPLRTQQSIPEGFAIITSILYRSYH